MDFGTYSLIGSINNSISQRQTYCKQESSRPVYYEVCMLRDFLDVMYMMFLTTFNYVRSYIRVNFDSFAQNCTR